MRGEIDTHLFLDIIQSEGVNLMYNETTVDGDRVEFLSRVNRQESANSCF